MAIPSLQRFLSRQVMPNPLVHVIGSPDRFGHFGKGTFDESAEPLYRVFPKDKDILRTVKIVCGYLRIICQKLLVIKEGFEGTAGQTGLSLLADVNDTVRAGKTVEVLRISKLLCRGAGNDKIAHKAF